MKSNFKILAWIFIFNFSFIYVNRCEAQEVGIQLYSLRNQFKSDIPGTLQLINSWGITKVEGGDSYGMPLDEFKALLKKKVVLRNNVDLLYFCLNNYHYGISNNH